MQRAELVLANLRQSLSNDTGKPYTGKLVRTVWGKITGNLMQECIKAPVIYPTGLGSIPLCRLSLPCVNRPLPTATSLPPGGDGI